MIKYDGYMKIQKRKLNTDKPEQYLESTYLSGLLNGPQFNVEAIDKFVKMHKIEQPYNSTIRQDPGIRIPPIQEI